MLGLGALDSRALADDFVSSTGTDGGEIAMVWELAGETRSAFGVRSQPYWLYFDADGNEVTSRPGVVDVALIESLLP